MVDRYAAHNHPYEYPELYKDEVGDYVLYKDYEKLEAAFTKIYYDICRKNHGSHNDAEKYAARRLKEITK